MKTAVGLFDTIEQAQAAWQGLLDAGYPENDLNLIAHSGEGSGNPNEATGDDATAAGATGGAVVGGALGILAGLAAFAIPGIGPALAIGPLVGGLVGAGAGALTGGLVGSLADAGVAEEDAAVYWEGVRRGGSLVVVNTHGDTARAESAMNVLNQFGAVDIKERGSAWRKQGWQGYRANADPYNPEQVREYRRQTVGVYGSPAVGSTGAVRTNEMPRDVTGGEALTDHELSAAEMSGKYVDYMKMDVAGHAREDAERHDLDDAHNFEPSESELRMNERDEERRP